MLSDAQDDPQCSWMSWISTDAQDDTQCSFMSWTSSDAQDLASDDEEEWQKESDPSRKFLKDNNPKWEPLCARPQKNAQGFIFDQGQSTTQDLSSLSQMATSHGS